MHLMLPPGRGIHTFRPVLGTLYHQIFRGVREGPQSSSDGFKSRNKNTRQLFTLRKALLFQPQYGKDKIPHTYTLVYENSLGAQLSICRILSTIGGLSGLGIAVWCLIENSGQPLNSFEKLTLSATCFCCAASVLSVNLISRYYLIRIYHNEAEGKFTGMYQTFFGKLRQFKYSPEDIQPITQDSAKPIDSKMTLKVKNRTVHVKASDFILPKYYNAHLKFS